MKVRESNIGSGIMELYEIGSHFHVGDLDWEEDKDLVRENRSFAQEELTKILSKQTQPIIASLTHFQKAAKRLLLKNGFKRIHEYVSNPNTDNDIALFAWEPKKTVKVKASEKALSSVDTSISCGISGIVGITNKTKHYDLAKTLRCFDEEWSDESCAMLIAAPDPAHKKAIRVLRDFGFKKARALKSMNLYVKRLDNE